MKRSLIIIIICMLLTGCTPRDGIYANFRPLEQLRLVETLGYDTGPTLSAAVAKTEAEPTLTLSARGRSLPDAVDALQAKTDRGALFFAHVRYVLLGEAAATEGFAPLMDYMERDVRMRLDTELFLLDCDAMQVLTAEVEEFDVTAALDAAKRESEAQACGLVLDFRETALKLSEYGAAPVMLLRCEFPQDKPPRLEPSGCGVLREGRLAGTLDRPLAETLGLLLGTDGVLTRETETATLLCRGGGTVSLTGRTEEAPAFSLRLEVAASVDEARGPVDADALETELKTLLESDAAALTDDLRAMDADLLELGGLLRRSGLHPAEGWLRRAEFAIEAEVTVDRSYDLEQPMSAVNS